MKLKYLWIVLLLLLALLISACGGGETEEEPSTGQEAEQSISLTDLSPIERGELWATEYGCIGCHSTDGSQISGGGPTWLNVFGSEELLDDDTSVTVDEPYLIKSILDPGSQTVSGYLKGVMEDTFEAQFEFKEKNMLEDEGLEVDIVSDLVAYIQSLAE